MTDTSLGASREEQSYYFSANMLHDASKGVRKASTSGNEGSCSGHVDVQNRLQQEASAATASQVHQEVAKLEQEAGTVATAGQVHR